MTYKYSDYIDDIEGCPPANYQGNSTTVYRWVHEDIRHPNDFLPVAMIDPKRVNSPRIDSLAKCKGYGLSLYDTLDNSRKQYRRNSDKFPAFGEKVGKYVAEGRIAETDGVISPADKKGHLTFHEYRNVDLKTRFSIVGRADSYE